MGSHDYNKNICYFKFSTLGWVNGSNVYKGAFVESRGRFRVEKNTENLVKILKLIL